MNYRLCVWSPRRTKHFEAITKALYLGFILMTRVMDFVFCRRSVLNGLSPENATVYKDEGGKKYNETFVCVPAETRDLTWICRNSWQQKKKEKLLFCSSGLKEIMLENKGIKPFFFSG